MFSEQDKKVFNLFADNTALFEAVKRHVESKFDVTTKALKGTELSNSEIGEKIRAQIVGLTVVTEAFDEILRCKTVPSTPEAKNPAR